MGLTSPKQPQVIRLTCGGAEDHPANAEPPTYKEMKETLGTIMSLALWL